MKVRTQGFISKAYDATFEEVNFLFEEAKRENDRTIRVTELNSGLEFLFVVPNKVETPSRRRKRN